MRLLPLGPAIVLLAAMGGCVSSESAGVAEAPAIRSNTLQPQQRSYLDAGPAPARPRDVSGLRANSTGAPGHSDTFSRGVLPSFF
jgi:hypothetical protein